MSARTAGVEPEFTLDPVPSAGAGENGPRVSRTPQSRRPTAAMLAGLAVVVGAAALYYFWPRAVPPTPQVASMPPAASPEPAAQPEPAIAHPVENIPGVAPADGDAALAALPALDQSDVVATDAISTILNGDDFASLLVPDGLIRRIVATVDNLPRRTIATRILPVRPVAGPFATAAESGRVAVAAMNAGRYDAYVKAAEAIDTRRLAGFYVRLYPMFQQAYVELGYPNGYFNDRLVAVVDHLLAAPEPRPPVYVSQPKVLFEFADPELEQLSAGQKIMVRVGLDNELRLKAKLRDIRKALTAQAVER